MKRNRHTKRKKTDGQKIKKTAKKKKTDRHKKIDGQIKNRHLSEIIEG